MVESTFELALELRTQLAISVLNEGLQDPAFDPDEALLEVFTHVRDETRDSTVREWSVMGLGGEEGQLPEEFKSQILDRMEDFVGTCGIR